MSPPWPILDSTSPLIKSLLWPPLGFPRRSGYLGVLEIGPESEYLGDWLGISGGLLSAWDVPEGCADSHRSPVVPIYYGQCHYRLQEHGVRLFEGLPESLWSGSPPWFHGLTRVVIYCYFVYRYGLVAQGRAIARFWPAKVRGRMVMSSPVSSPPGSPGPVSEHPSEVDGDLFMGGLVFIKMEGRATPCPIGAAAMWCSRSAQC